MLVFTYMWHGDIFFAISRMKVIVQKCQICHIEWLAVFEKL